jgi:hypothetical protein
MSSESAASASASSIPASIHDQCRDVVCFHNSLCNFFKALKSALPETKDTLRVAMTVYRNTVRADYIRQTSALMAPHAQAIAEYNEILFTPDDSAVSTVMLLPGMDFLTIWQALTTAPDADPEFVRDTKKQIFNHLQIIYIWAVRAEAKITLFDRNLQRQRELLENMLQNMKLNPQIKGQMEKLAKEEAEAAKAQATGLGGLGGLGGVGGGGGLEGLTKWLEQEDNFVIQMAKEIAEELDLGKEDLDSPVTVITELFSNGGQRLREIMYKIQDKLQQKLASGQLDKKQIILDTLKMKAAMERQTGQNFDSMMGDTTPFAHLTAEQQIRYQPVLAVLRKPATDWTEAEAALVDECVTLLAAQSSPDQPAEEGAGAGSGTGPGPKKKGKKKAKKGKAGRPKH